MWTTVALFVLLSPGLLFTIPAGKGKTSVAAVLVHALIFALALYLVDLYNWNVLGFSDMEGYATRPVVPGMPGYRAPPRPVSAVPGGVQGAPSRTIDTRGVMVNRRW